MAKSPQGFIVVLHGEIIEIAQDDDISWLTLFYALPKELAEKYPDALKIPRSPYEVLYEGSYGAVAKSDMLKMLVWDCYSWAAWQFFKVKDRKRLTYWKMRFNSRKIRQRMWISLSVRRRSICTWRS